jgi:phosphate transport system protein
MERHFERELKHLQALLLEMGGLAESMIAQSVEAAASRKVAIVHQVLEEEERIDELCIEIDNLCFEHLARQGPVASDLRLIVAGIKANGELERIADRAVGVALRARDVASLPATLLFGDLRPIGELVREMVHRAVEAFVRRDPGEAKAVIEADENVNAWRDRVIRDTLNQMMADSSLVPVGLDLILIARNLERIGDHATNIAEDAIFFASGLDVRLSRRQLRARP